MSSAASENAPPPGTPTRLLVVMPSLRGGGAERFVETLLSRLDRTVVSPTLGVLHRLDEGQHAAGIPADVPIIDFQKRSTLDLPVVAKRMAKHLDESRPDVVLGVMTYPNLLALAARRLSRHRPSVVASEHTNPDLLGRSLRRRWQVVLGRRLYPEADAVVCVSEGQRMALLRLFRLRPERVMRIYNGSHRGSTDASFAQPAGWPQEGPVVVFAGRLVEVKGVSYLIEAMAILRRRIPARLMVLGEGDQGSFLERRVQELGLGDAVRFLGHVPDPTPYFAAADVVAVPSLSEAFSITLVEATRAGAAIVASDCDYGPREVIRDSHSGILVRPADATALATGIEQVLSDPMLAARIRRGARSEGQRFAPEVMVAAYEALISSLSPRRQQGC